MASDAALEWQPRVSVLMAAHNAARFIGAAIESLLWQTYQDFELVIVDDASTDDTAAIIRGFADPRIRLIAAPHNLGVVAARNLGFASCTGAYLAIHDADDISHPTRLARQVNHLDTHPGDVLVSTEIRQLHPGGELVRTRYHGAVSPLLLEWMLHLGNPIAFSSTMMRTAALRRLPEFLREERRYAEDYDLYARLRAQGGFTRIAMPLIVYRVYPDSTSALNRLRMVEQTGRVLDDIWPSDVFAGHERLGVAATAARHFACSEPAENAEALERLRFALDDLIEHFMAGHPGCTSAERDAVALYASRVWENTVRLSLRAGAVKWPSGRGLWRGGLMRVGFVDFAGSVLRGALPDRLRRFFASDGAEPSAGSIADPAAAATPPVLHVTVVLEQSGAPALARHDADVTQQAQKIFDAYGLRPAYLLDAAAARQPACCTVVRNIQDAGFCLAGAWWQPGTPPDLVPSLLDAVAQGLGAPPAAMPAEVLGGAQTESTRAVLAGLTAIPLTQGVAGAAPPMLDRLTGPGIGQSDSQIAGLSNRADLGQVLSLSPASFASEPQIMLIKTLLARGERQFFLRLHLRQAGPESALALDRLRRVCTYFFEELGGLPGNALALSGAVPTQHLAEPVR